VSCDEGHCITCSDAAVPMTIRRVEADGLAECVDPDGAVREVDLALLDGVGAGHTVLVHAGVALAAHGRPDGAVAISWGRMPRGGDL
jgi:hydrogenase expression/formation protein HypC